MQSASNGGGDNDRFYQWLSR